MAARQISVVLKPKKDQEEGPLFLADIAVGKSPQFSPSSFRSSPVFPTVVVSIFSI